MPESQRIEDLRRRVHADPTSIAFAQLAEELRRAGSLQESVETCRAGLAIHPSYLSARVTLGRALLELGQLDAAQLELQAVLPHAPDNLSARRALGEIFTRRGALDAALDHYRTALLIAPNDPDLEEIVTALERRVEQAELDAQRTAEQKQREEEEEEAARAVAVSFVAEPGDSAHDRDLRMVAVLETWLDAINVTRAQRRA
ncbi:MAG TPA: tetratricopeptide repeat protein [Vicinamibacterales bacterium]|jgi:tetratricopeptide (TPR) repeat protein|nr:tetratricopeptide repeat protein [Vicinamibacterales bacterium]